MKLSLNIRPFRSEWRPRKPTWASLLPVVTYTVYIPPYQAEKVMLHRRCVQSTVAVLTCVRSGKYLLILSLNLSKEIDPTKVRDVSLMIDTFSLLEKYRADYEGIYLLHYLYAKKHLGIVPSLTLYRYVPKLMRLKPKLVENVFGGNSKSLKVYDML